ncbi:hypothetical protein J6590_091839 [Homalodisca vitripennis]|nr:hypothetical protein J6590_091839 [Homalodisca vitripennis]
MLTRQKTVLSLVFTGKLTDMVTKQKKGVVPVVLKRQKKVLSKVFTGKETDVAARQMLLLEYIFQHTSRIVDCTGRILTLRIPSTFQHTSRIVDCTGRILTLEDTFHVPAYLSDSRLYWSNINARGYLPSSSIPLG